MESVIVVYTNSQGYKEFRKVPNGYSPIMYDQGIVVGPPSLDSLAVSKKHKTSINNWLVDHGIVEYSNLSGNKKALLDFIVGLGYSGTKATVLRNEVILTYQKEAYPDSFELEEN